MAGAATSFSPLPDLRYEVFVFPQETEASHVLVRAKPEEPLQNFTVCLRSYTDLTRPHSLFSYATKAQDNEILLFKPKPGEYRLYVGGKYMSFSVPTSIAESEHVCASWESTTGIVGFWFNGKPWPRKGLQRGYTVGGEAAMYDRPDEAPIFGWRNFPYKIVGEVYLKP
ncbi:PREDICTED: mucosal pentraxin-like [Tauraco erythrolophus]|nr:PREDICTED: mucosal pentraxin-like [Tauraco erythrolophus]